MSEAHTHYFVQCGSCGHTQNREIGQLWENESDNVLRCEKCRSENVTVIWWPPFCDAVDCHKPAVHRVLVFVPDALWVEYCCDEHIAATLDHFENPRNSQGRGYYEVLEQCLVEDCKPDARPAMARAILRRDKGEI